MMVELKVATMNEISDSPSNRPTESARHLSIRLFSRLSTFGTTGHRSLGLQTILTERT